MNSEEIHEKYRRLRSQLEADLEELCAYYLEIGDPAGLIDLNGTLASIIVAANHEMRKREKATGSC
jgi:hypothetical protein